MSVVGPKRKKLLKRSQKLVDLVLASTQAVADGFLEVPPRRVIRAVERFVVALQKALVFVLDVPVDVDDIDALFRLKHNRKLAWGRSHRWEDIKTIGPAASRAEVLKVGSQRNEGASTRISVRCTCYERSGSWSTVLDEEAAQGAVGHRCAEERRLYWASGRGKGYGFSSVVVGASGKCTVASRWPSCR